MNCFLIVFATLTIDLLWHRLDKIKNIERNYLRTLKNSQRPTHNIKQLGFSGLREFGSRISILVGGQERSPKTQPFHIVKRWQQL